QIQADRKVIEAYLGRERAVHA
ncbi:MAG: hypothetical protein HY217_03330, partial [Candidatus Rokubacteria bacterium]|nr:hypothetical protein [Candidatus Rokubacteria bacterium]